MKKRISIGADPGTSNYGYSVLSFHKKRNQPIRFDVIEIGMVVDTVTNLTAKPLKPPKSKRRKTKPMVMELPFRTQFKSFLRVWEELIEKYKPIKISAERFQTRGIKGKTIEAVSMMNGGVATIAKQNGIVYEVMTAATWKNQINSVTNLDEIYLQLCIPAHIVDAVFINVHGILTRHGLKWSDVDVEYILEQLEYYSYDK